MRITRKGSTPGHAGPEALSTPQLRAISVRAPLNLEEPCPGSRLPSPESPGRRWQPAPNGGHLQLHECFIVLTYASLFEGLDATGVRPLGR
jgi:hypothetical protein